MKIKLFAALLALMLFPVLAQAQIGDITNPLNGRITVVDAGTCSTANSFVAQQLPQNASTTTVNLSGTFTATLTVRESNNGGASWTTATTLSAAGTSSFSTNGFTHICVDATAFTSGTVLVSISTGILQVQSVVTGGSSSSTSNPAPNMGFYLTNACLVANTQNCFYTTADLQEFNDCAWTNASTTITCNTAHFGAGQSLVNPVGMSIMGFQSCANDLPSGQATGGEIAPNVAAPTVLSFTSTTLVISATPANTQTLRLTFPLGGCITLAHIDDSNMTTFSTAVQAATTCPKVFLAAANYFITTPPGFLFNNPTACANIGPGINGNFGNTTLPAGYEVEGRGVGPTGIYLSTNFPNGDACTHTPTNAGQLTPAHTGACFTPAVMGKWQDFRIDGGGQGTPTLFSGKTLIYAAVGTLQNFTCTNYGGYGGGASVGIEMSNLVRLYHVNNAGCGVIALWQDSGSGQSVGMNVVTENNNGNGLFIAGTSGLANVPSFTCYLCYFSMPQTPLTGFGSIRNAGGILRMIGGTLNPTNNVSTVGNTISGYTATVAGSIAYFDQVNSIYSIDPAGTHTNSSIVCTATCTNYFHDTVLTSQSGGFDIQDVAGSVENDLGGNTGSGRFSISGSQVGDASITGTTITAAKLVLSAGWGASAAWTALSGQTRSVQGTITNTGAGQAANPTIVYTFPTPFWSATNLICSASQVGGTQGAILNTFTPSALTATGVTFTYNGTPTVGLTEIVQISCGVK